MNLPAVIAAAALAAVALAGCGDGAKAPEDSDLLPLPENLTVIADDGGSCGNGGDYQCDRAWLVVGPATSSREDVAQALAEHLRSAKDWPGDVGLDGIAGKVELPGRRSGYLAPFGAVFDTEYFSNDERDLNTVKSPVREADVGRANRNGVVVVMSDCCGDGLPL